MASAPIADLSYRDYNGPLSPPLYRWWVIARATMRMAFRKKGLWFLLLISGLYYFVMLIVFFFVEQSAQNTSGFGRPPQADPFAAFMSRIEWKDQFVHGWSIGQMWLFFVALLVGAGSIANDNRANALLVYLSKPCDKRDYLFGKWMGVFLTLALTMSIPTLSFYFYCGLSYSEFGFFSDKLLLLRLIVMIALGAAFHASLAIGVSSLFKQGRIAGATYAAIYFISNFFTVLMMVSFQAIQDSGDSALAASKALVEKLSYGSVDGIQIGMAKAVLGTDLSPPFGMGRGHGGQLYPPAPNLWLVLLVMSAVGGLAVWIAWKRIKPVEVVS